MQTLIVRYKTSATHADTNERLVSAVFEELRVRSPHIATVGTTDPHPLTSLPAFKAFQAELKSRCVEAPEVIEASLVGSYEWVA